MTTRCKGNAEKLDELDLIMIQLQALDQVLSADLQPFKLVMISTLTPSQQLQLSHSVSSTKLLAPIPFSHGTSHAMMGHVPFPSFKYESSDMFHACMQMPLVSSLLLASHVMLCKMHTKRQLILKHHFRLLPLACTVNACIAFSFCQGVS